jgi:hypothetical protein
MLLANGSFAPARSDLGDFPESREPDSYELPSPSEAARRTATFRNFLFSLYMECRRLSVRKIIVDFDRWSLTSLRQGLPRTPFNGEILSPQKRE